MNGLNGGRSLSHSSRNSLDGATAYIAGGKDARRTCLEIMWRPVCFPPVTGGRAGQHESIRVHGNAIAKPTGTWLRTKKKKHVPDGLIFDLPLPIPSYRLESRLAA